MLPPGTPQNVAAALRAGFDAALKDKGLLDEAAKQQLEINNPMTGDDIRALIDKLYAAAPETIARGAAASTGKFD